MMNVGGSPLVIDYNSMF